MGSVREKAIRGYLRHTPRSVRNFTDPVVKISVKAQTAIKKRGEAGGKTVNTIIHKMAGVKRKTR